MPGVLMLEALAQAAGLLSFDMMGEAPGDDKVFYFVGIEARVSSGPWSRATSSSSM